jgi:ribosome-binding protein aMBF1 (putative translation factor)
MYFWYTRLTRRMETPILEVMPPPPTRLDDAVRERIRTWIQSTGVKQTALAPLIGKPQPWIRRYLAGELDADLETLQRLARIFGHQLTALFDAPADPGEARLTELYRALPEASRPILFSLLEDWTRLKTRHGRNRK